MGNIGEPAKAKPFFGILFKDKKTLEEIFKALENQFGKIETKSEAFDFSFTNYYEKEMGKGLKKIFVSTKKLMEREKLVEYKIFSNSLENKFSYKKKNRIKRRINIDPGYITPSNLILASTKEFYHRIYLGRGIFGEVTMRFSKKGIEYFPWSYADYQTHAAREFFLKLRENLLLELKDKEDI